MTRVLLFLDSSGLGGIETHVATLAEALPARGLAAEILFWRAYPGNAFEERLARAGLPFSALEGRFGALLRRLRGGGPVLLHTHGYKAGILGRLAARLAGVPVVSTYHAGERGRFPVNLYQLLDEWTGCLAERLAVSGKIARELPFGAAVVPNFIAFPPLGPARPRRPQIGFVGRLSPEKAPDRFLALAGMLGDAADFHIFGNGPMRPSLESPAGPAVIWHGMVSEPGAIWPALDLLVMPSRAEGLPMAALEALAQGIPIVATDAGDLRAVIGRDGAETPSPADGRGAAGWLVGGATENEVMAGLAAAVRGWLALPAPQREALRHAAHFHGARHFGLDEGLGRILAAYGRAAGPA